MRLGVVIVNFGQEIELERMLDSIREIFCKKFSIEIVLVDNSASIGAELESSWVESFDRYNVNFCKLSPGNIGYIKGLRLGHQKLSHSLDFVFLTNPDLEFYEGEWEGVLAEYSDQQALIAPDIVTPQNIHQNPNRRKKFSKLEVFLIDVSKTTYWIYQIVTKLRSWIKIMVRGLGEKNQADETALIQKSEIWQPHGSCMITNASWNRVQASLDHDVFLWGEEALIAGVFRGYGIKTYFDKRIKVLHNEHSATDMLMGKQRFEIWKKSYAVYRPFLSK